MTFSLNGRAGTVAPAAGSVATTLGGGWAAPLGAYLAYLWFAKRGLLDHEPGEDLLKVDEEVTE